MKLILFVCTGNTCRSSMAGALALRMLKEMGKEKEVEIKTVGTAALQGAPASPKAVEIMDEEGIDLRDHRARLLTPDLVSQADLILTMTLVHKQQILQMHPEASSKTFTLKEFASGKDTNELQDRLSQLALRVETKEAEFYARNGREIKKLEEESQRLWERLTQVEKALVEWHDRLEKEVFEDKEEMRKVERELRAQDLEDPYGKSLDAYRKCAQELKKDIYKSLKKLWG